MNINFVMLAVILLCCVFAYGEVSPDDLIKATEQMSPEQVYEFRQKLEAKMWEPVPQGFFTKIAVNTDISWSSLDDMDMSSLSLSDRNLKVDEVAGLNLSLLWALSSERFRIGIRAGSWEARDSGLSEEGYSRIDVLGGNLEFIANYQWIRSNSCVIWSELAPGIAGLTVDVLDTPASESTTLRSFDASFSQLDLQTGVSWRANPSLHLFISGGYRFAESVALEEGGSATTITLDTSGAVARVGFGVGF